jgi:hypothetical protein
MVNKSKNGVGQSLKLPAFVKAQIEHAQERLGEIEGSAEKALKDLLARGREGRKELTSLVERLAKDERFAEIRDRLDRLQKTGADRAEAWRDRAESFRSEAMERMVEFQSKAVRFLGVATRDEVAALHRDLDRLSRKIERRLPTRRTRSAARGKEA